MDFLQATSDAVMNQRSTIRHMRAEGAERVAAYHARLAQRKAESAVATPVVTATATVSDKQVRAAIRAWANAPMIAADHQAMRAALEAAAGEE